MVINRQQLLVVCAVMMLSSLVTFLVMRGDRATNFLDHSLLNPVVDSSLNKHFIINFQPLRRSFDSIKAHYSPNTRVYFSYLNNAAWVGVGERDLFTAASLIKVPLAMAVYKAVEDKKLDVEDVYDLEEIDLNSEFGELYKDGTGSRFTVERLIEIMLTQSDDTAANALYKILTRIGLSDPLNEVYRSMGWEFRDFNDAPNYGVIHVKVLSNMFLALYNATYVNPEHSQQILEHLTNTPFNNQIVAGVPKGILVAHKIGIYEPDGTISDCGIVYAPHREYVLCAASSGLSRDRADEFVKEVSQAAYEYVLNN